MGLIYPESPENKEQTSRTDWLRLSPDLHPGFDGSQLAPLQTPVTNSNPHKLWLSPQAGPVDVPASQILAGAIGRE